MNNRMQNADDQATIGAQAQAITEQFLGINAQGLEQNDGQYRKKQQQAQKVRTHFRVHGVEEKRQDQRWENGRQTVDQLDENHKKLDKPCSGQKQADN